jgi:molybdopterin adenylyltransferase
MTATAKKCGAHREAAESMQNQVGIITISDRASAGEYEDSGGPALKQVAQKIGWHVRAEAIVPDEITRIQETIRSFARQGCGLILTTGGTGIGPRDVTPEAIRAMMRVELPGFGEVMRAESMKITPNAILSRNLAAVVDQALVIALPGKPSGAVECLSFVQGAIRHGVALAQRTPTSC